MRTPTRAGGIAIAVLAAGLALSGCGSDKKTETTSSASSSSSSSSSASSSATPTAAPRANETIADYIKKNNINEASVSRGDPGSPTLNLPIPEGWADDDAKKPEGSYGQIAYTGDPALASKPPVITAIMSKLSDNAEPAEILSYAPGEVKNLPGFEGGDGEKDQLSGFDAFKIGGTYVKDGAKLFVAQKTVVIPGNGDLFVLQFNARGPEAATGTLLDAMNVIDQQTKITPP
jgi:hypothetical protein